MLLLSSLLSIIWDKKNNYFTENLALTRRSSFYGIALSYLISFSPYAVRHVTFLQIASAKLILPSDVALNRSAMLLLTASSGNR